MVYKYDVIFRNNGIACANLPVYEGNNQTCVAWTDVDGHATFISKESEMWLYVMDNGGTDIVSGNCVNYVGNNEIFEINTVTKWINSINFKTPGNTFTVKADGSSVNMICVDVDTVNRRVIMRQNDEYSSVGLRSGGLFFADAPIDGKDSYADSLFVKWISSQSYYFTYCNIGDDVKFLTHADRAAVSALETVDVRGFSSKAWLPTSLNGLGWFSDVSHWAFDEDRAWMIAWSNSNIATVVCKLDPESTRWTRLMIGKESEFDDSITSAAYLPFYSFRY